MQSDVICTSQHTSKICVMTGYFFQKKCKFFSKCSTMWLSLREKNNMFFIAVSKIEQNYLVRIEEKQFVIFLKTSISPSL